MQEWWPRVTCGRILGYLCLSRILAFAYLGVAAWKVFVSEIVLAFPITMQRLLGRWDSFWQCSENVVEWLYDFRV
jgi:hypothetical protein